MNWNRILSGLVAVLYVVVTYAADGAELAVKVAIFVMLPLACIWFADAMGSYTGPSFSLGGITNPTPGWLVLIGGWLVLLLPVIVAIISEVMK